MEKRNYYNNLDMKVFNNSKKFWQNTKPLFSDKTHLKRNRTLVDNGSVISKKKEGGC